jgi:condensin-2 complex subunit G2
LGFLFELHAPFIVDINATIRNQIPNQRKSILKKFGAIYFKAWVSSQKTNTEESEAIRVCIEEQCIQRYVHDAVHAGSISLFTAVRAVLQIFFENKRHAGVDEMLYRITSPILWRGVKAANDSVRRQAAVLLFDNFPLRDPHFNHEMLDRALQKQFDVFEELLGDSHPAVRIAAIQGVAKVLSVYWELLPAETIRCFISKLVVDLVNDVSSSAVRAAVFEGVQFILDNHNSHAILKPLLPMVGPLST